MKKNELIKLRQLVVYEKARREELNKLLEDLKVKEYLKIKSIKENPLDINNIREILKDILKDFKIEKTNGIYVCTNAYYIDSHISYQDTDYYTVDVDINSKDAERKTYVDIESGKIVRGSIEKDDYTELIKDFENNNLILNPYNKGKNKNGYDEVRMDFFETALETTEARAKRHVLLKYPKL